jgi:hypothetical protein
MRRVIRSLKFVVFLGICLWAPFTAHADVEIYAYALPGCPWTIYNGGGGWVEYSGVGNGTYQYLDRPGPDVHYIVPNNCASGPPNPLPRVVGGGTCANEYDPEASIYMVAYYPSVNVGQSCQCNSQCPPGTSCTSNVCGIPTCSATSCASNAQCVSGRCGNTLPATDPYYNKCVAANYGNNCTLTGGCFATANGTWNCPGNTCVGTTPPPCSSPNVCCGTSCCPNGSSCASGNTCVSPACVGS